MPIGQIIDQPDLATEVGDLLNLYDEALVIGVTPSIIGRKPKITIVTKAPQYGGNLLPYLKTLLEELVQQHEQTASNSLPPTTNPY